jgi:hypothetical protein
MVSADLPYQLPTKALELWCPVRMRNHEDDGKLFWLIEWEDTDGGTYWGDSRHLRVSRFWVL